MSFITELCCLYGCYMFLFNRSHDEREQDKKEKADWSDEESGDVSRVSFGLVMRKESAEASAAKST